MQFGIAEVENIATTTSLRTILQILAAANNLVRVHEIGIFFAGVASTAVPIDCTFRRQAGAGTSTALVAGTNLNKYNDSLAEALTTSGFHTFTVEPTQGDELWVAHIHPQSGIVWRPPVPCFIGGADAAGITVNAAADINISCYIVFEE